jgi:hypothetical protein
MKWTRDFTEPTEDPDEFETLVLKAVEMIRDDGSIYVSHKDICRYNRWNFSRRTSQRIGRVLNSKFSLIRVSNRTIYMMPEAA